MNNKLTDERVSNATLIRLIQWADQHNSHYVAAALCELQERRKADNQEPAGYHVIKECGKVGCSVATLEEAEKTRDFWNKKWTIRPYFYSAAPAPVVLEEMPAGLAGQIVSLLPCPFCGSPAEHYPDGDMEGHIIMCGNKNGDCNLQAFGFTTPEEAEKAWNTRAALLQGAEPVSQTYELPELIEGMEVSVDVSTCDFDAGHRYFGTVTEVSELDGAKNGYILLVQDAEPNFKTA
ncbi:TPA: Lar family restriction alleviation protein, partial [Salmonella enterica]